jgi:N-acyl-phosphatidylethanolamine-hydrolysing phospholipase D
VPAIHEGDRTLLDSKAHPRSFTGFLVRYHGLSVYYRGDTAFSRDIFETVYRRYGSVDLAILPIGPIEPRQ